MRKKIVGVMGPGEGASEEICRQAYELGCLVGDAGHVLLTGGRPSGVMEAALQGARSRGGLTLGILPDDDSRSASEYADLVVVSGMGSARNNINVLTGDVIVAVGMGAGTASEVCLALKASRQVVLVKASSVSRAFFQELAPGRVRFAEDAREAMTAVDSILTCN